jgi:hypothetical protein
LTISGDRTIRSSLTNPTDIASESGRAIRDSMKIQNSATLIILAVVLSAVPRPAAAQHTGMGAGVPVQIVVSLEPRRANEVPTVTQHEVFVHEGHDSRPVTAWVPATGEHAGLALAILIDDSGGVNLSTQLSDLRTFIQQQAPTTRVALGYMRNGTVMLTQNFTEDHAAAAKSLRLPLGYFGAEPSPYLSLSDFIKRWTTDPAVPRREVLMVTSGIDTVYAGVLQNPYVDAAIQDAQCAGVVVYSIYTPSAGTLGTAFGEPTGARITSRNFLRRRVASPTTSWRPRVRWCLRPISTS